MFVAVGRVGVPRPEVLTASDHEYVRSRPAGRRSQSETALALLRTVLAVCAPAAARAEISRGDGKPVLRCDGIDYSVSHSSERVAVAVGLGRRVGVDVQRVEPRWDGTAMAALVLTPAEIRRVTEPARPGSSSAVSGSRSTREVSATEFAEAWARKEALVKLTGEGIGPLVARLDASDDVVDGDTRIVSTRSAGYALALAHAPFRGAERVPDPCAVP